MTFYTCWYATAIFFLILVVHIASAFLPRKIGDALEKANICLHILMVPLLLLANIPLDEVVLLYLLSLLIFLLSGIVSMRLHRRKEEHRDL